MIGTVGRTPKSQQGKPKARQGFAIVGFFGPSVAEFAKLTGIPRRMTQAKTRHNHHHIPCPSNRRILQKVITQALAEPDEPYKVNLLLKGLQVEWEMPEDENDNNDTEGLLSPSSWWPTSPLQLQGPLTAPFGSFQVLYLDDEIRVVQTNQGYYAINKRSNTAETEWF